MAIVARGASWHAAALERAWREDGHRVVVVTGDPASFPGAELRAVHTPWAPRGIARRSTGAAALSAFTKRARVLLEREQHTALVLFPGTALELAGLSETAVLLADDGHARSLAQRLDGDPRGRSAPRGSVLERLEAEHRTFPVIVPTQRMADDPRWSGSAPITSRFGLPPAGDVVVTPPVRELRLVSAGETGWRHGTDRLSRVADLDVVDYITAVGAGGRVDDDVSPGVRFVGEQDEAGVVDVFRRSHAFVLLARDTANAASGLTALAAGLPVLVTEATGLAPFCAEGAGVVVSDDASVAEYSAALVRLRSEWAAMSTRAVELSLERPWRAHASEILDVARGGSRVV